MPIPMPASRMPKGAQPFARHFGLYGPKLGTKACLLAGALLLTGCQSFGPPDITGSIGLNQASPPSSPQELADYTAGLQARYDANPSERQNALAYARALRRQTRYAQAVAVLQRLAAAYPKDMEILGDYGKALVDAGRLQEAADVLPQAHTPENPNWTILSAQGTVADQLGDHAKAQEYYQAALKIVPNQPDVLSNLGLSYALAKQLPLAEATLQLAASQPTADLRVRQNLALVLALEGKFEQAQSVSQHDLPPLQAAENVTAIRQMIAQSDTWNDIRAVDGKSDAKPARHFAARKSPAHRVATRAPDASPAAATSGETLVSPDLGRPTTAEAN